MEYIALIHKEDGSYVASVPDLNYTSSFGETFKDAVHKITEAAELYCEDLEKLPAARSLEELEKAAEIEAGDIPQIINPKVEKLRRINVMISSNIVDMADIRAKLLFDGNRSAYIQNLISIDARESGLNDTI
ncbi:type II toxin-antitoxin system HicB family antitoxin [Sulfurovum sp. zt1-1]|uniref:Type II toxin-antitoxin system HicB family antitoxin n=1 Tax=Sulfurovum zhangzhouensis TaxID=3019067 RepID=A0ABT7QZ46_9BACT|nr:type II toxin-antitoxin system HicB family antitoxin [Sulfurovum zhangzhouensis]MDM5272062.1 type II toxin-antitoxin system HicB family antitoxin [Sulfurovum zhangzhouensis]